MGPSQDKLDNGEERASEFGIWNFSESPESKNGLPHFGFDWLGLELSLDLDSSSRLERNKTTW